MESKRLGWQRFREADWAGARDAFTATLADAPDDAEALDGLGQALWWLGERDAGIDRRREAFAAYRREGDALGAARIAVYLAGEHRIDGRDAASSGWLARARRLLEDQDDVVEVGWLEIEEAKRAGDPVQAERHSRAALDLAHRLADPDVECMALAQLGSAVVRQGRVGEGLEMLDEAMTVALGGEGSDPLACGDACCTTLVVCDSLADLDRAAQWCEAVVDFAERRRYIPVQAWCRGIYGGVLVRAGEWERAEAVLTEALRGREDRRRGGGRVVPLAVLAELRLRQGRIEEAEQLLAGREEEAAKMGVLARLRLAQGDLDAARMAVERHAAAAGEDDPELVASRGELALALDDFEAAARCAARLEGLGNRLARPDLGAEAALLRGRAAAERDELAATAELEAAIAGFAGVRFPLEEARARLALAEVQAAAGSPLAAETARASCNAFERLGAAGHADRAAALLRRLGVSGRRAVRGADRDELTAREREVLDLVVAGLSNAEIAERLVIAPKTAEHHVGRVLAKLGARSRAEAAAMAVRDGL